MTGPVEQQLGRYEDAEARYVQQCEAKPDSGAQACEEGFHNVRHAQEVQCFKNECRITLSSGEADLQAQHQELCEPPQGFWKSVSHLFGGGRNLESEGYAVLKTPKACEILETMMTEEQAKQNGHGLPATVTPPSNGAPAKGK